jgi:hypothetical protein
MYTYRCLQLLVTEMNSITSDYLLMAFGNISITIAVLGNFMIIRYHDTMPPVPLFLFTLSSFTGNMYMWASYLKLGDVNQISQTLISSKRRAMSSEGDNIYFIRFIRSCSQHLRIHMSSFGYYKKPTSIRVIGKIVVYTARILILTKKLG